MTLVKVEDFPNKKKTCFLLVCEINIITNKNVLSIMVSYKLRFA